MSPLFLRYMSQYTYCISMYRYVLIGTVVCIRVFKLVRFFLSTKMYVLAGIRTYLVIYARICLASFGLPDSGAVKPTALRAYRKLSCQAGRLPTSSNLNSLNISPAGPPPRARTAHVPRALWPVKYRADVIEEINVIEETIAVQSLLANQ